MKSNKRKIGTFIVAVYFAFLMGYLLFRPGPSGKLTIKADQKGQAVVAGVLGDVPGSFKIGNKPFSVHVRGNGRAEAVVEARKGSGKTYDMRFSLPLFPKPINAPGGDLACYPSVEKATGRFTFLGCRGSSLLSLNSNSYDILNGKQLTQIDNVTWSPDGLLALVHVTPEGNALRLLSSPLQCSQPTTFLYDRQQNTFVPFKDTIPFTASFDNNHRLFYGYMNETSSTICSSAVDLRDGAGFVDLSAQKVLELKRLVDVVSCQVSPDGKYAAYFSPINEANNANDLNVLETSSNKVLKVPKLDQIYAVKWSPASRYLLVERRDKAGTLPSVFCLDINKVSPTSFAQNTYLSKVCFYNNDTVIFGLPYKIEDALARQASTPDSLMYGSLISGAAGQIVPATVSSADNYSNAIYDVGGHVLYYTCANILRYLDLSKCAPIVDTFASSQVTPLVLNSKPVTIGSLQKGDKP